jgi:AbrB family looped-hinge helix DNA binding protein
MKMLGSTKISGKLRITIPKDAAESLQVQDGDHIIFYVDEKGQHIVKKG